MSISLLVIRPTGYSAKDSGTLSNIAPPPYLVPFIRSIKGIGRFIYQSDEGFIPPSRDREMTTYC